MSDPGRPLTLSDLGIVEPGGDISPSDKVLGVSQGQPTNFRWATVKGTGPLRIQFDGETEVLPIAPETLVTGLTVDLRVWVQIYGTQPIILGIAH